MPGLGMCQNQELRQELRQEMRLLQRQEFSLLDTDDGLAAAHELEILEQIALDLKNAVYSDVADFLERVGKRVAKDRRTDGTRALVASVRAVATNFGLNELREVAVLIDWIRLAVKTEASTASVEFGILEELVTSQVFSDYEMRRVLFARLESDLVAGLPTTMPVHFLKSFVSQPWFTKEIFKTALLETRGLKPDSFLEIADALEVMLCESTISPEIFGNGIRLVRCFESYLGHLNLVFPARDFRYWFERSSAGNQQEINGATLALALVGEFTSAETLALLEKNLQAEPFSESKDAERALLRAILRIKRLSDAKQCLEHFLGLAETPKQLYRLAREVNNSVDTVHSSEWYPLEANSADEFLWILHNRSLTFLEALVPNIEDREAFLEGLEKLRKPIPEIVLRLAQIYNNNQDRSPLTLLRKIVKNAMEDQFFAWRYEHQEVSAQLEPLKQITVWRKNKSVWRVVGPTGGIDAKLKALLLLRNEAEPIFQKTFNVAWTESLVNSLGPEITQEEERLRTPISGEDKRVVIAKVRHLRNIYEAAHFLELFALEIAHVELAKGWIDTVMKKPWAKPFAEVGAQALAILAASEFKEVRRLEVRETDKLDDLLQVGVLPVQSCQRWTEPTCHNHCLMAYVADANKKLWQVRTTSGAVIGRVIVRLLPFKRSALLMVEPPYASQWSEDCIKILIREIFEKAADLADENKSPIYVGFVGVRRWSAWEKTFEEAAEKMDTELKTIMWLPKIPPSRNAREYSDSLSGELLSGEKYKYKVSLTFLGVGPEDGKSNENDE